MASLDDTKSPLITVVIPCPNSENFIRRAIQSILDQTHENLEVLIVLDRVTDSSFREIESFTDKRIRVIDDKSVSGISQALNLGYSQAKGDFIARMDADDTCSSVRLETQLKHFLANPYIDVLGTACTYFGERNGRTWPPLTHADMWYSLGVFNPILHASILFRRELVDNGLMVYDASFSGDEDYALWGKLFFENVVFENIDLPLYQYRIHKKNAHGFNPSNYQLKIATVTKLLKNLEFNETEELSKLLVDFHYNQNFNTTIIRKVTTLCGDVPNEKLILGPFNHYLGKNWVTIQFKLLLRPLARAIRRLRRVLRSLSH
jgi:glycosyltransferase involved in cell wall biosynthesis